MDETLRFLETYGYLLLFGWLLAERVGLPLPSAPALLAAGALARTGRLSLSLCALLSVAACLVSDTIWYDIGRRQGGRILRWLCRISLEPDSCVRRTEDALGRHGSRSLLFSKFLPGLNVAAVPLAGMLGMERTRFLLLDAAGSLLWVMAFLIPGYAFASQLEIAMAYLSLLGTSLAVALISGLALYIGWKYLQRHRFLRSIRIARITAEDLDAKLSSGEEVVVLDLRHSLEFDSDPHVIPGAVHIPAELFDERHGEIPRDREIVLYCT